MKKVIFISALAIAAAVSCTKSDIVDTKFNEAISFETYTGRDAMTKATVTDISNLGSVYVYGYYTGTKGWDANTEANLWAPMTLGVTNAGVGQVAPEDVRYWTNETDQYTFLAYAPAVEENVLTVAAVDGKNPTITYNVPVALASQKDLLYAVPQKDRTKGTDGTVALQMKHALARLTVKAKVSAPTPFEYHVKEVSINGAFNTTGTLVLADQTATACTWKTATPAATAPKYEFLPYNAYAPEGNASKALPTSYFDYSGTTETVAGTNYLMMIPTDFSKKTGEGDSAVYTETATLTVKYTTYYRAGKLESAEYTKTFKVNTNFEAGKAYSINLDFIQATNNEIKFTVDVTDWGTENTTTIDKAN
jgi:hypothetical protein